jgi:hypothetical protein
VSTKLLDLRRIDEHVTTGKHRMAWYTLPPQRWNFRTEQDRHALLNSVAMAYAGLVGHKLHLRVTTQPYPVDEWGRELDAAFPGSLPGWGSHIVSEQKRLLPLSLSTKLVHLGVELKAPAYKPHARDEELVKIGTALSRPGIEARQATAEELSYLLHRSCSIGAPSALTLPPATSVWEATDIPAFTDQVEWIAEPFARSVQLVGTVGKERYVRHNVVLTLGRMLDVPIPEVMEPWLSRADRLRGIPVEWSIMAEVLSQSSMRKFTKNTLSRITSQVEHYEEHSRPMPIALSRQASRVQEVTDEVTDTNPLHTRMNVWVRAAVSGDTEAEALDQAQSLAALYDPHLPMLRGKDQWHTLREFIPGNWLSNPAHKRLMPVKTFAGALPTSTPVVGHRNGFHLGRTSGTAQRAVCWHPWHAMEVSERSGLTVVTGKPGAGKSTLSGVLIYNSVLAGVPTLALDPSGPLARLCSIPALADYARAVDLMDAEPGALNPYAMIPDPRVEHYEVEREPGETEESFHDRREQASIAYHRATKSAPAARRALVHDTLMSLLPEAITRNERTFAVLSTAIRQAPATVTSSPREVLRRMWAMNDEHARLIADTLADLAELPQVRLVFPEDEQEPELLLDDELLLQVMTMRGNVLPEPGKPRAEWTLAEMIGLPLLNLAAHLSSQHIYRRDRNERKLLVVDEVHQLTSIAAGQALARGMSRDSRKHNARVVFLGQNSKDTLVAGVENLVDTVFAGLTEGEEEIRGNLKLLGVPIGAGYESVLPALSPNARQNTTRSGFREFIFRDGDGGIERIQIDVPAPLMAVLDTTADPTKVRPKLSVIKGRSEATA